MVSDWKLWYNSKQDIAGAVKVYEPDFSFWSVKGCGHTIPTYCPEQGFLMLDKWLNPAAEAASTEEL